MNSGTDDDTLMARTARGEEEAFRLLVLRWEKGVLAFLIHMLGSVEEAEDLVQETFVQVFRKASRYQPRGQFKSWLFRIAGNLARSALRRRKVLRWVRFESDAPEVAAADPGPMAHLEQEQAAEQLRAAVAHLPPRQREALALHRFQGLKYKEVAEAMETTVSGVESLIQRAMMSLRKQLASTQITEKRGRSEQS